MHLQNLPLPANVGAVDTSAFSPNLDRDKMGERKVVSKYIPADFDPKLIPRGTKLSKKDGTVPVRMMLPFSVQCETCHTFLYRGRKFNSKKEAMGGPDGRYLGIQRWRFYIKCANNILLILLFFM